MPPSTAITTPPSSFPPKPLDPALERVASLYRESGWPAEVSGDAFTAPYSAPSAGPPPWQLYRFTFHTAIGQGEHGAIRWRFGE